MKCFVRTPAADYEGDAVNEEQDYQGAMAFAHRRSDADVYQGGEIVAQRRRGAWVVRVDADPLVDPLTQRSV